MPKPFQKPNSVTTLVLVHGAWAGSWVWSQLRPLLEARGYDVITPDLPGCGDYMGDPASASLANCVTTVEMAVSKVTGPLFLLGHSGAGAVVTEVAENLRDRVSGVIFLAGMMLPSGSGFGDIVESIAEEDPNADGITPYLQYTDDGLISQVPVEAAQAIFFNDLPEDAAKAAAAKLVPQAERSRFLVPQWSEKGFGCLPRLYIEATQDLSVTLSAQRAMQTRTPSAEVVTLKAGHVPQVSQPALVAEAVVHHVEKVSQS